MSERKFETVGAAGSGEPWKPHMTEKNFMKMGTDNVKEGYLLSVREVAGKDKPFNVYLIQVVNPDNTFGKKIEVVGDSVLVDKFNQIPFGSYIRVEYKGRLHKKDITKQPGYTKDAPFTQTNSYHLWEVGVDQGAMPYNEMVAHTGGPEPAAVSNTPESQNVASATEIQEEKDVFKTDDLNFD
jgi:hypothetical protein